MKLYTLSTLFMVLFSFGSEQQGSPKVNKERMDGVTVVGEFRSASDTAAVADTLYFRGCEFHSGRFKAGGFSGACYTTRKIAGGVGFNVELTDPACGTVYWKGSITDQTVEAVIIWKTEGEPTKEYEFTGRTILPDRQKVEEQP